MFINNPAIQPLRFIFRLWRGRLVFPWLCIAQNPRQLPHNAALHRCTAQTPLIGLRQRWHLARKGDTFAWQTVLKGINEHSLKIHRRNIRFLLESCNLLRLYLKEKHLNISVDAKHRLKGLRDVNGRRGKVIFLGVKERWQKIKAKNHKSRLRNIRHSSRQ